MKKLLLVALAAFPCLAAEDDGDWDFLKSRLPKEENEFTTIRNPEITNTFRFTPAALKFIEAAETVTVFEGLPHQTFDAEALQKELEKTDEIIIGGYPFYPVAQPLRDEDEMPLKKLLANNSNLRPFLYYKMCGGFHPDYAIRFTKGEEHCDLLLCFGCGDARILHNGKVIHAHFYGKRWRSILSAYAKLRPKQDSSPEK